MKLIWLLVVSGCVCFCILVVIVLMEWVFVSGCGVMDIV